MALLRAPRSAGLWSQAQERIRRITQEQDAAYAFYMPVLGRARYTLLVHDVATRKVLYGTMHAFNCQSSFIKFKTPWDNCVTEMVEAIKR